MASTRCRLASETKVEQSGGQSWAENFSNGDVAASLDVIFSPTNTKTCSRAAKIDYKLALQVLLFLFFSERNLGPPNDTSSGKMMMMVEWRVRYLGKLELKSSKLTCLLCVSSQVRLALSDSWRELIVGLLSGHFWHFPNELPARDRNSHCRSLARPGRNARDGNNGFGKPRSKASLKKKRKQNLISFTVRMSAMNESTLGINCDEVNFCQ